MGIIYITPSALVLLPLLLSFSTTAENSVATHTLTRSKPLVVGEKLVSSGQIFELGFFSLGNSSRQYIGIWYKNISALKPIWVANREIPLNSADTNSSLTIDRNGNLRLLDGNENSVWSTNISIQANSTTIAMLCAKGNLIIKDNVSGSTLWDSFAYPGDTFISGMELGPNVSTGEIRRILSSWRSDDDPSPGEFINALTTENPPQSYVWKDSKPYWRSGPWDGWKFIGLYSTEMGYSNGVMVSPDNDQGTMYLTYNDPSESYATQIVLTPEGILKMSHWYIDVTRGGVTWRALNIPCEVYGTCGPFGVCERTKSKKCECLRGFVPKSKEEWSKGNWTGGCMRRAQLLCEKNASLLSSNNAKMDGFRKFNAMKLPDHHLYKYNLDESGCRESCLRNCSCMAYAYVDKIGCMIWGGELLDIHQFSTNGADLYLRVAYAELHGNKKKIRLIIILTVVPGVIFLAVFIYGLSKRVSTGKGLPENHTTQTKSQDLSMFNFNILAEATTNFSETNKLGSGGFGPVYRGKLEDGREIAVKRLSSHSGQGGLEFKNEILLISKLRHRNLVQLLGYCIEGDDKLLVYEYLKNRSLDIFLFDVEKRMQLDWNKRYNIIEGIARGLVYLHRESCLRIIHRDLKAANILLDDNMSPKISDFGIAKAFHITQELANTQRVVGTHGYMAPEYAAGGLFSEKSDVYSFGVLLLEIVSGKRIISSHDEEKPLDLMSHAWHLWKEGMGLNLMDNEISKSCYEADQFLKCLQIGLLCVQDYAMDRPTMSDVILMLTSGKIIPHPTKSTFYQSLLGLDRQLLSSNDISRNDLSLSIVQGR